MVEGGQEYLEEGICLSFLVAEGHIPCLPTCLSVESEISPSVNAIILNFFLYITWEIFRISPNTTLEQIQNDILVCSMKRPEWRVPFWQGAVIGEL